MKKENMSELLSKVDQKLLSSIKDEFGTLSNVDKQKVIDSTNSIMDSFCDVLGIDNKYKLTEDMFTDCKDKCKDVKDSIKEKKDKLADLAKDTLDKLGISDEFIKKFKVDGDKIYIDVQMPIEDDTVSDIDLNIDEDGVSYDDTNKDEVNVPKYTRKNKVKNKKSRKIKFTDELNKDKFTPVVEQEQVSVLDRLKSEAKPVEEEKKLDENEIIKILVDKVSAIIEDDDTHDYVVFPREGNIPPSVQVELDDVCSCVMNNCNILTSVAEALKDKYDFPDVYLHVSNEDTTDDTVKVVVVMTLEN